MRKLRIILDVELIDDYPDNPVDLLEVESAIISADTHIYTAEIDSWEEKDC